MVDTSESNVNAKGKIEECLDCWLCRRNECSGSCFTNSVFVFEIARFSMSTGFSWDHRGIFAALSSTLVKKKFQDISIILCEPGHKWDISLNSGTVLAKPGHLATMCLIPKLGNYMYAFSNVC